MATVPREPRSWKSSPGSSILPGSDGKISPTLHAICPFGGVVSMYQLLATGELVRKNHESAVVLMGGVFLLALLFGPVFCG